MKKKKRHPSDGTEVAASPAVDQSDLLGDGEIEDSSELKVSESFSKKYNARKDKEELARANRILAEEGDGSESEESEDEDAELLTSKVNHKIFDTLQKIKSKHSSVYDDKHTFFEDQDFEEARASASSSTPSGEKKVRYKDFLRNTLLKDGADALVKEEEAYEARDKAEKQRKKKGLTPLEEQQALKAEILGAAWGDDEEEDAEDGLFSLKTKSTQEQQKEADEFQEFSTRMDKAGVGGENADDIMAAYWKADEDLDEGERFLRDYVLNEGWKETSSLQAQPGEALPGEALGPAHSDSEEEEEHLNEVDEFEKEYNFRFEVDEGSQIQGHARFQESSVRERPDKRKRQRKEKAERKDAEKIRRTEELKRLKNLKKDEIRRRLQQLKDITGNEDTALGAMDLDGDFDPDKHDQDVSKLLGEDFEDKEEPLASSELMQTPAGCGADLDISNASVEALERRRRKGSPAVADHEAADAGDDAWENEVEADAGAEEEEAAPGLWFLCDSCQRPIPGGKKRFDCTVCEDYVLCAKCFRVRRHPHKFVRRRVPEKCQPPEDLKGKEAETPAAAEVLDEYFQLDYEDIIGGDLPTRFKYRKVEGKDFGMSVTDILTKTDQELNKTMPLKKLRTFAHEAESEPGGWGRAKNKQQWKQGRQQTAQAASASSGVSSDRLSAYSFDTGSGGGGDKKRRKT